jgi:hypothetical protein
LARIHHKLDWLNVFEDSTSSPTTGALKMGEIAVQDLRSGIIYKGVESFRLLCKQIPAYWPYLLLLKFARFRAYIAREVSGCADDACRIP